MKILIVEDEAILFMVLEKQLGKKGYDVCENAPTKDKAVELYKQEKPDVVLMDIRLAEYSSGIDAAKEIIEIKKDAVIIFMTAYADDETYKQAMSTDPLDFLEKPVHVDTIDKIIKKHFENK